MCAGHTPATVYRYGFDVLTYLWGSLDHLIAYKLPKLEIFRLLMNVFQVTVQAENQLPEGLVKINVGWFYKEKFYPVLICVLLFNGQKASPLSYMLLSQTIRRRSATDIKDTTHQIPAKGREHVVGKEH